MKTSVGDDPNSRDDGLRHTFRVDQTKLIGSAYNRGFSAQIYVAEEMTETANRDSPIANVNFGGGSGALTDARLS